MAKKSKPSGKGESKTAVKEVSNVTITEEPKESVQEQTIISVKEGGIINFYYFFSALGIVIGIIMIIAAVFRYIFHVF